MGRLSQRIEDRKVDNTREEGVEVKGIMKSEIRNGKRKKKSS